MAKDIVTRLKELKAKTRSKENSLIECKEDIQKGMDAGFSIREIFLVLKQSGVITYSYSGFIKAVKKHLGKPSVMNDAPRFTPKKKEVVHTAAPSPSLPLDAQPEKPKFNIVRREVKPEPPKPFFDPNAMTPEEQAEQERKLAESERLSMEMQGKPFAPKSEYTLMMEKRKKEEKGGV